MNSLEKITIRNETLRLLEFVWPHILKESKITERDLKSKGYDVFVIYPGQVILAERNEKLGFDVLIPNNIAKKLKYLVENHTFDKLDLAFGSYSNLAVFSVTLRDESSKYAIIYPVYYNYAEESRIRQKGGRGFYVFFRILSDEVVVIVELGNYKRFLASEILRGRKTA